MTAPSGRGASIEKDNSEVLVVSVNDRGRRVMAKVRGMSAGYLHLASPLFLRPNEEVELTYLGCTIVCRVAQAREISETLFDVRVRMIRSALGELRAEPRVPVDLPAVLYVLGKPEAHLARVTNISSAGLGIRIPLSLPVAAPVTLDLGSGLVFGEVRHCRTSQNGYTAGLFVSEFIARDTAVAPGLFVGKEPAYVQTVKKVLALIRTQRNPLESPHGPKPDSVAVSPSVADPAGLQGSGA